MSCSANSTLVVAALTLFAAGCGESNSAICRVSGTLTYQGKPIPQVYLRFEPDDLTTKTTSAAMTDANGKFEMSIGSTPGVYRGKVKIYCDDPQAAMGAARPCPPRSKRPIASSAPSTARANRLTS